MEKTKLEILLVEDEDAHVELIRRSFRSQGSGISLMALCNLQDAKNYLNKSIPDLVIADFLLPDGKGTELLDANKERLPYPVIIMTSYGNEAEVHLCLFQATPIIVTTYIVFYL